MKFKVEVVPELTESEVTIKCSAIDDNVLMLQKALSELLAEREKLVLKKGGTEYYQDVKEILFFETDTTSGKVIAHTVKDIYTTDYKLYELEGILPPFFMRISKSAILNVRKVYGITKNITSSSRIEFSACTKTVFVSRNYYRDLVSRINIERLKI